MKEAVSCQPKIVLSSRFSVFLVGRVDVLSKQRFFRGAVVEIELTLEPVRLPQRAAFRVSLGEPAVPIGEEEVDVALRLPCPPRSREPEKDARPREVRSQPPDGHRTAGAHRRVSPSPATASTGTARTRNGLRKAPPGFPPRPRPRRRRKQPRHCGKRSSSAARFQSAIPRGRRSRSGPCAPRGERASRRHRPSCPPGTGTHGVRTTGSSTKLARSGAAEW